MQIKRIAEGGGIKEKYGPVIGLSHDVDIPEKYNRITLKSKLQYLKDANRNDYWRFDDIMEIEQSFGTKSTFYFCTHNRYSAIGNPKDVAYDIKTKKFKDIIHKISNNGFSIGLHAGINQYSFPESFIESQELLKKLLNHEVIGVRHHWWNVGNDKEQTFKHHFNAGFKYDTSLCSEEITGFMDGRMHPYYIGNTMEVPTFLEDSHMMYYKNTTFKDFKVWIEKIIQVNGIGCIDWHVRTSSPYSQEYKNWGGMYIKILKYITNKDELWVTDIDSIYKYYKGRCVK